MEDTTSEIKYRAKSSPRIFSARISSIDSLRAVTMLLMVFVNDLTTNVPSWLKHAAMQEDNMGFSDIIFPAFLFIVGLSLPLAINNRINKGDSNGRLLGYILSRAFALVLMGFFHVNLEHYSQDAVLIRPVWQILITICFFLIWLDYPRDMTETKKNILRIAGAVALVALAVLFKGGTGDNPVGMQFYWGGILGLIGWAYLVCAYIYFFFRNRPAVLIIMWALLIMMNVYGHTGGRTFSFFGVGDASSSAITMAGVVASVIYSRWMEKQKADTLWWLLPVAGILLIAMGFLIRPYTEGISKIRSTPAWIFICTGISVAAFGMFVFIVDLKNKKEWFKLIRPAGTSTLTCYLLPYIVYALYSIFNVKFPEYLQHDWGAIIKSLLFAFIIVQITGLLERGKLRLRI